jgi:hypothetical protein
MNAEVSVLLPLHINQRRVLMKAKITLSDLAREPPQRGLIFPVAERVRFELTKVVKPCRFSSAVACTAVKRWCHGHTLVLKSFCSTFGLPAALHFTV